MSRNAAFAGIRAGLTFSAVTAAAMWDLVSLHDGSGPQAFVPTVGLLAPLWVGPWAVRKIGHHLPSVLAAWGWSRPAEIQASGAQQPIEFLTPAKLPTTRSMSDVANAGRGLALYQRMGKSEDLIARRDELRRQALLMVSRDLDRLGKERDLRSPFMRLQSCTWHAELEDELRHFLRTASAWLERRHHVDHSTRSEGMHVLNVLADHCARMANDQTLLKSDEACARLAASLRTRRPQLQSTVDALVRENRRRLLHNMDVLSDHLGYLQEKLGDRDAA